MRTLAIWDPARGLWENPVGAVDLFSEHSEPFLATWPASGMTRRGVAFELPMPVLRMGASGFSFLPTPKASDGEWGTASTSGRPKEKATHLATRVSLLPTPEAKLSDSGPDYASREGSGGDDLTTTVFRALLPTPTVQDGSNTGGPSQFRRNTKPLNTEVLMLPTPRAADGPKGAVTRTAATDRRVESGRANLAEHALTLLPTPVTSDANGTTADGRRDHLPLRSALLPTPQAHDAVGGKTPEQVAAMRARGHGVWNLNEVAENDLSGGRMPKRSDGGKK